MSAVPFEFPLTLIGHAPDVQLISLTNTEATLELLEVHSAATGIRAGIT